MIRLADAATGVLVTCAVVITVLVAKRELFPAAAAGAPVTRKVKEWREIQRGGTVLGSPDAPVRIVAFSDFQCPYCARADQILADLERRYAGRVAVVFRHYPLEQIHAHAAAAALASECAGEQNRFEEYSHLLFRTQDSIGTLPWKAFAERAGVTDLRRFEQCVAERRYDGKVRADMALGRQIGVDRTPMFLLDNRLVAGTLALPDLEQWVGSALKTREREHRRGGG
jgi:protein-disulfide isomerase